MKKVWTALLALCFMLALTACGAAAQPEDGAQALQTPGQGADNTNGVTAQITGSSANFDLSVTGINRYGISNDNEAIFIECSITNKSSEEQAISSILCFSASDTSDNEIASFLSEDIYDLSAELENQGKPLTTLDGTLQPGQTLAGSVLFMAPKGTRVKTLIFDYLLTNDKITLQLGGI